MNVNSRLAQASARLALWGIDPALLPPKQPKTPQEPDMPKEAVQ